MLNVKLRTQNIFDREKELTVYKAWCKEDGHYNPLATLMWKTEGGLIRTILGKAQACTPMQLFVFSALWFFFMCTTYGTFIPAGLFLPGMIIGCGIGDLYTYFIYHARFVDQDHYKEYRTTYVIIAMGSMLSGYTRMTYSLVVCVMETAKNINIFLPVCIAIGTANSTGYLFTRSLYERAVRGKQIPILLTDYPRANKYIRASDIMNNNVKSLKAVDTINNIYEAL